MENSNNEIRNEGGMDFQTEKIAGLVQMMKLLTETNSQKSENHEKENNRHYIQEFDEELQTPALKTIKAAIPYLEYEYQKNLGMFVKIMEMNTLLKKYRTVTVSTNERRENNWQRAMLKDVSAQLDGKNKGLMQMLIKIIDIQEIMQSLKEIENEK